jgi:hypothetical protein
MVNIKSILCHEEGVEPVSRHLCRLAAGLENTVGFFRPFSARDAHVIHQLKCSAAGVIGLTSVAYPTKQHTIPKPVKYVKLIFDSALHAGKAARSSKNIPILDELREVNRKNHVKTNGQIYVDALTSEAEQQVLLLAIEPTVKACASKFAAMGNSKRRPISTELA